ncbi:hypothetical protein NX722_23455 [Endozoicomonas gorgoniicola]|uniref:Uncharacterized protein n=1 Tax=Endozoicomonas gorgoniicola TaxID=1234144 RepID=A0ABT3N2U6_9GAMM|nr:hypothetical protein [Endozoicomonas gorgoniicola]MCW7555524.1 hypothetical protein [Endozoicomonas gorgoniicola]
MSSKETKQKPQDPTTSEEFPEVFEVPEEPEGRRPDLSMTLSINWPSNPRVVCAPQYLELPIVRLLPGQLGYFTDTPEGYVLERLDLHAVEAVENEVLLALETESGQLLAAFAINGTHVKRISIKGKDVIPEGQYLGKESVFIRNIGNDLNKAKGKLVIAFRGYLIEYWR